MEFLNPSLLLGAGFVSVPVVLHLIMRQRPRQLEFPALRFVRQAQELNRRTMRLRHWLLLLLRMAAIGLLALALARPSMQTGPGASLAFFADRESPVAAALIIDTMPHMLYRHDNLTRLEAAQEMSAWLLGQLPSDSQVSIVDGDTSEAVFQVDLGAARQRISRLESSATARSVAQLLSAAVELLRSSALRRELYVFTDLSRASWPADTQSVVERLRADLSSIGVYVIDVGVTEPQNFSLGELRLSGQVLSRNSPLSVTVDVSSVGVAGRKTIESFILGRATDQGADLPPLEKRAVETVDVGPNSAQLVELKIGALEPGTRQGVVRIAGGDGLPTDNERYFTIEVRQAWRILVAAPPPADRQAYFYTQAVAPALFRQNGQARFDCHLVEFAALAAQPLDEFAAVVLLNPPPLANDVWNKLTTFALGGGGVAVCLGENATQRESFNQSAAQELLPGPLDAIARFPLGDVHLQTDDRPHPLLSKFRPLRDAIPWEDFPVYRYWRFAELTPGSDVACAYSNDKPAIIERTVGQGRSLVVTTPLSEPPQLRDRDRWNLLPSGLEPWPFVMLANELTLYLVGSRDEQLNYLPAQTAVLRLEPGERLSTYNLFTPRGDSLRRNLPPQQTSIIESTTTQVGNYRLEAGGAQGGVRRGFSVNLPTDATRLDRVSRDDLKAYFGSLSVRVATTREQIERDVSTQRVGHELFGLLIGVVAIVLGCEHVLANRFYRQG